MNPPPYVTKFTHILQGLKFTFIQENDNKYIISTIIHKIKYEGNSFLKPIGKLGVEKVKELLNYVDVNCKLKKLDDDIMLTIPIPFSTDDIVIKLIKENVDEIGLIHRELTKLKKENKQLRQEIKESNNDGFYELGLEYNCNIDEFYFIDKDGYKYTDNYNDLNNKQELFIKLLRPLPTVPVSKTFVESILFKCETSLKFAIALAEFRTVFNQFDALGLYEYEYIPIPCTSYVYLNKSILLYNKIDKLHYMTTHNGPQKISFRPENPIVKIFTIKYKPLYKKIIAIDDFEKYFKKDLNPNTCNYTSKYNIKYITQIDAYALY